MMWSLNKRHVESLVNFLDRFSVEFGVFCTIINICSISIFWKTDSSWVPHIFEHTEETRYTTLDFGVIIVLKLLAATALYELYRRLRSAFRTFNSRLFAIVCLFVLSQCFLVAVAAVRSLGFPLVGLDEAAVFFVLLMDRCFIIDLVRAFHAREAELRARLSRLLYRRGFELVLDSAVSVLAIGVGLRSGSLMLVSVCSIVALSLVVYTAASLTIFPAFILLFRRSFSSTHASGADVTEVQDDDTSEETEEGEEEEEEENLGKGVPTFSSALCAKSVARIHRRMKVVIVIGLLVLHVHAFFCARSLFRHSPKPAYRHSCQENAQEADRTKDLFSLYCPHMDNMIIVIYLLILSIRDLREEPPAAPETRRVQQKRRRRITEQKDAGVQVGYRCRYSHSQTCVSRHRRRTASGDVEDETLTEYSSDEELLQRISCGEVKTRELEDRVKNCSRAVSLRRRALADRLSNPCSLDSVPWRDMDYKLVLGRCCEEVIGYTAMPLGFAGPLLLDGVEHYVPLATTEGCLVASTNRGCRVVAKAGGVRSEVFRDGMTRAPVLRFPSIQQLMQCVRWIESNEGFDILKTAFDSTGTHANLKSILPLPTGCYLHLRFTSETGDAMGMNMVSKGCERALVGLTERFPTAQLISLSGNACSDKKAAAINWVLGRGKSVLAECRVPAAVLQSLLKLEAEALAQLCRAKNFAGSAAAGTLGGFNAHAANLVAAIFIATGQDPAQVVESSSCLTMMEADPDGALLVTCTMPCLEVATVGGGTGLPGQQGCLRMLDLDPQDPAVDLARIVAATVLCAELNLMAALSKQELVSAHMKFNRRPFKPHEQGITM